MRKYIFLDFNGTILNDVDLCLDLLNQILIKQGKKTLTVEEYKNVFTFPVKDYYQAAGVDFEQESFESLAQWFIQKYQPASMECGLYEGLIETLSYLKEKGYHLVILSASQQQNLLEQCEYYQLLPYFEAILGIQNIHAASKAHIALDFLEKEKIAGKDVLFIGDTLHDLEVAEALGAECKLVSCGHQSVQVLQQGNVEIIPSVAALREQLK